MAAQDAWRYCRNCYVLFYDGYPHKGACASGGGHQALGVDDELGENYLLSHSIPENAHQQAAWRYCRKCHSLFYNGFSNKGVCTAGGEHDAEGFDFVLSHDVPATDMDKVNWRFCKNCYLLFYDGHPGYDKGACSASKIHVAQGFSFVLGFRGNLEGDVVLHPVPPS